LAYDADDAILSAEVVAMFRARLWWEHHTHTHKLKPDSGDMLKEHQRSCCHLTKGTSGTAASTQQLARAVSAVRKMNRWGKK
jgi:hypothetical protein